MRNIVTFTASAALVLVVSAPAFAEGCAWGNHAYNKETLTTASTKVKPKIEEAMTTFDPKVLETEEKDVIKTADSE